MTEWREVSLGDLGDVVTGGTPAARNADWFGDETPFITPTDIGSSERRANVERCLSAEGRAGLRRKLLPTGSVCFVSIGATIGKLCMTEVEAVTNQQINSIVPNHDVDGRFLYYLLRHEAPRIAQMAGGAATPIINKSTFSNVSVLVPDSVLQARIGLVLGVLDDLIENDRRRVEVLEEMARAIYREWFVYFRYPGHENAALVESALGPIPDGWRWRTFAEVASFVNGFAFKPSHWGEEGWPIIKIKELKQGVRLDTPRCPPEAVDAKYHVKPGELLFSWSADLGVYLWDEEPGLLNQHLFVVTTTDAGLSREFLFHALNEAMPQFRARAQGTTMKHIKRSALNEVMALLPGDSLGARFADEVAPLHAESANLQHQSRSLAAMRNLLLPKLVTGQIDVSGLDLDALAESAVA